jgi:hypothetical protein
VSTRATVPPSPSVSKEIIRATVGKINKKEKENKDKKHK